MNTSRSRISSRSFIAALAIVAAATSAARLHAFEVTSKAQGQESWTGFGDDFNPTWSGVTKKVNWTLPKPANYGSYGSILMVSTAGWGGAYDFEYKPIELLWSKRSVDYSAEAAIDQVVASDAYDPESSQSGPWSSSNARYGEVTDLKGTLLANGSTIGTQWSDVKETSLTAEGRVGASVIMESSMLNRGRARAAGKSQLEAAYRMNEPANFSLTGMLAGEGDLSLDFELVDDAGNAVYKLSPTVSEVGGAWKFDLQGTLDAGTYTLSVSADVAARMGGYQSTHLGGEGEYEINFSATPVTPFVPREKPQWQKDIEKLHAGFSGLLWSNEVTPPAVEVYQATVPEPASLSLLACGLTAFMLTRKR
ncbi:MAG: PEP-CTERM sorting domain-containing protein [Planctomycetaceae bacterium]|nr:PEP-CTERM sorting domain-containing protein [Planctomycetaceae bacterium]